MEHDEHSRATRTPYPLTGSKLRRVYANALRHVGANPVGARGFHHLGAGNRHRCVGSSQPVRRHAAAEGSSSSTKNDARILGRRFGATSVARILRRRIGGTGITRVERTRVHHGVRAVTVCLRLAPKRTRIEDQQDDERGDSETHGQLRRAAAPGRLRFDARDRYSVYPVPLPSESRSISPRRGKPSAHRSRRIARRRSRCCSRTEADRRCHRRPSHTDARPQVADTRA